MQALGHTPVTRTNRQSTPPPVTNKQLQKRAQSPLEPTSPHIQPRVHHDIGNLKVTRASSSQTKETLTNHRLIKLMMLALNVSATWAADTCESTTINNFNFGLSSQIALSQNELTTQPPIYETLITSANQTARHDLSALQVAVANCLSTPGGAGEFTALQSCTSGLITDIGNFQSPLIPLNTTIHQTFTTHYQTESSLTQSLIPYTRDAFQPLTGTGGFFDNAVDIYTESCQVPYSRAKTNQTAAAISARATFLDSLSQGFAPMDTHLSTTPLTLSSNRLSDMQVCNLKQSAFEIRACLEIESMAINTEIQNLYTLIGNIFGDINGLTQTTPALDSFYLSSSNYYSSMCSESYSLIRTAEDMCGYVPPTNNPTSQPTSSPTTTPTHLSTQGTFLYREIEKETCVGIPALPFGLIVGLGSALLAGVGGYLLGVQRTEKRLKNEAVAEDAAANSLEDSTREFAETESPEITGANNAVLDILTRSGVLDRFPQIRHLYQTPESTPDAVPPQGLRTRAWTLIGSWFQGTTITTPPVTATTQALGDPNEATV